MSDDSYVKMIRVELAPGVWRRLQRLAFEQQVSSQKLAGDALAALVEKEEK